MFTRPVRFATVSCVVMVLLAAGCPAQTPGCETPILFQDVARASPVTVLSAAAEKLHGSVLAELWYGTREIELPAPSMTLNAILPLISPNLVCTSDNEVITIYDPDVKGSRENALNYEFQFFLMPRDVSQFSLLLRGRLAREPFLRKTSEKRLMTAPSGYLAYDRDSYPLREESLPNITARDLLRRVAQEQKIVSIVELQKPTAVSTHASSLEAAKLAWEFANRHWKLEPLRTQGE